MPFPEVFRTTIGTGATLVAANVPLSTLGTIVDETDIVVDTIGSPSRAVYENNVGWGAGDRGDETTDTGYDVPIPDSFFGGLVDPTYPNVPNNSAAMRLANGNIFESQPFHRDSSGGNITVYDGAAQFDYDPDDTTPDFLVSGPQNGARGGSGVPVWFTTVRETEAIAGAAGGTLAHPMCWVVPPTWLSSSNEGYRWPATRADTGFETDYTGSVPSLRMGSLLCLASTFDVDALTTDLGKWIARNLKSCGAYVGDIRIEEAPDEVLAIGLAYGPDDDIDTAALFGDDISADASPSTTDDFGLDMRAILAELMVVANNSSSSIAGGGGGGGGGGSGGGGSGGGTSTVDELAYETTQRPMERITHAGQTITPNNPTSDSGVPGYRRWSVTKSLMSPIPVATVELNRIPESTPGVWSWSRGETVTIDAGYDGAELVRIFTGHLYARGNEDPEYLRTRTFVSGARVIEGVDPDQTERLITSFSTLVDSGLPQPALPAGTFIDQDYSNQLIDTDARAAVVSNRLQVQRGRVPRRPGTEVRSRTMTARGQLQKLFRVPEVPTRDFTGMTTVEALESICDYVGITTRSIIGPADPYELGTVVDAVVSRMRGSQMAQLIMDLEGMMVYETGLGIPIFRVMSEQPAISARWTYTSTDEATARVLEGGGVSVVQVPLNPNIELGDTVYLEIPEAQLYGNFFVTGIVHQGGDGYTTSMTLVGGDEFGGSVQQNPLAIFTATSVRQAAGAGEIYIGTLDARASFDPDGTIVNYEWTDNQTTSPEVETQSTPIITVVLDADDQVGAWEVTLTVTDNDGLQGTVTITVPTGIDGAEEAASQPAVYAALGNNMSASADGGLNWTDEAEATLISAGAKPYDGENIGTGYFGTSGGKIFKTTDFLASAAVEVEDLPSAVTYIVGDWRAPTVVWAMTAAGILYRSGDSGDNFSQYADIADVLGIGTFVPGYRSIGLPAGGAVFVCGGDGAGTPVVGFTIIAPGATGGDWFRQGLGGHLAADAPSSNNDCRVHSLCASGNGIGMMLLTDCDDMSPVYYTDEIPKVLPELNDMVRGTGSIEGLTDLRYLIQEPAPDTTAYLAAGDRDVHEWTGDGDWVVHEDVMPANVQPHDAIILSDVLTGLPIVRRAWDVAAENTSDDSSGLYKLIRTSEGIDANAFRPGADTWPASATGLMLAIGPPGEAVTAALAGIGLLTDGADFYRYSFGTNTWSQTANNFAALNDVDTFRSITIGGQTVLYCIARYSAFDPGDLMRSEDGGVTWTAVLTGDETPGGNLDDYGVTSFDIDPEGYVWVVESVKTVGAGDNNSNNTFPTLIKRSTEPAGDDFDIMYTDTGWTGTLTNAALPCQQIAINSAGNVILICTEQNGAMPDAILGVKTGSTWEFSQETLPIPRGSQGPADVLRAGANGRFLYLEASASGTLHYSDDFGASWDEATGYTGASQQLGWRRPDWFLRNLLAMGDVLYGSQDNGATWTSIMAIPEGADVVDFNVSRNEAFVVDNALDQALLISDPFGTPEETDITAGLPADADGEHWIGGYIQ